ncbi:hypothetical protein RhiirA5_377084 [Rhizophagus irregularis]|uniref:Uncharacterized protein n=1 Tax=Rhizophagus irregularis TaxID=588596 RepID=A0A2I1DWC4_9GLOM|nr:hypothetical protein RhiirA5_377084 [Rhizophagus irregularis]PKC76109.1 hypothetical protein RhiirA1_386709 [Rhizophagus irregularis]PKY14173.1 hypothetical protein RhiirB3_379874 [Rhizophagus irregularis]
MADKLSKMAVMKNMENNTQFMSEIDILCSITWEYNMLWRDFMIKQCPRGDINQIEYKAEWLALDINGTYRMNINEAEIDWLNSLQIIMKEFKSEISSYNIKNFLEIMPTMILNKRNPEIYKESRCVRCKFTHENWTHIWICKENDTTIDQITNFAFERLKEKLDNMDFRICETIYLAKMSRGKQLGKKQSEQESKRRDKAKSLHDNYKKESKKLFLLKISWEWWRGENLLDGSSFKTVS